MRKSTLFISAMLTVFMLATVFGVVSAYQQVVKAAVEETATPMVDQQIMNAAPTVEIPTAAPALAGAKWRDRLRAGTRSLHSARRKSAVLRSG